MLTFSKPSMEGTKRGERRVSSIIWGFNGGKSLNNATNSCLRMKTKVSKFSICLILNFLAVTCLFGYLLWICLGTFCLNSRFRMVFFRGKFIEATINKEMGLIIKWGKLGLIQVPTGNSPGTRRRRLPAKRWPVTAGLLVTWWGVRTSFWFTWKTWNALNFLKWLQSMVVCCCLNLSN